MGVVNNQNRATSRAMSKAPARLLSGDEVKTRLRERGMTLKSWALANKYPYATVSHVVRGVNRGSFGMGHRIAVALGMKEGA